jgi:hypothetical protein
MARENPLWGQERIANELLGETRLARVAAHYPEIFAKIPDRTSREPSP